MQEKKKTEKVTKTDLLYRTSCLTSRDQIKIRAVANLDLPVASLRFMNLAVEHLLAIELLAVEL